MSSPLTAGTLVSASQLNSLLSQRNSSSSSSSPSDDPRALSSQYFVQQPLTFSPDQSVTPEKLDVSVDLSAFHGLQDKMSGLQDKINYMDATNGGMGGEDYSNFSEILEMQRKRLVKAKRHRSENVSERDKLLFLNILGPKVDVIENRRVGGTSKMQMWRDIEAQFNASAEVERTYDQLRELWKRLKIAMKKELEVGRQKGFAPLPTSITRTFSLLKDFEFVDDVGGSHGQSVDDDVAGNLMQAGSSAGEGQQLSSPHSSPFKLSLDSNTTCDSSDTALLNAFHLSSLFAKREDGKTLAERLAQADLSLSQSRPPDSFSLVERITNDRRDEAKALAERLAHSDLGQDLTITQVNSSGQPSFASLTNGRVCSPDDLTDSKEKIVKLHLGQDTDTLADNSDSDQVYSGNSEPEVSIKCEQVLMNNDGSPAMGKSSPVPELVKLPSQVSAARDWNGDVSRRGMKRRFDTARATASPAGMLRGTSPVILSTSIPSLGPLPSPLHTAGDDTTDDGLPADSRLAEQRFINEQCRGRLIEAQLENERLRSELFKTILDKLKEGGDNALFQALKAVVS